MHVQMLVFLQHRAGLALPLQALMLEVVLAT